MKEHDIVRLKVSHNGIPKGKTGTIIYIYNEVYNEKMCEVEFEFIGSALNNRVETTPFSILEAV